MDHMWLGPVGHEYVGNHNSVAKLESTWCYVVFDSDLRNLLGGGELWRERIKILLKKFFKLCWSLAKERCNQWCRIRECAGRIEAGLHRRSPA